MADEQRQDASLRNIAIIGETSWNIATDAPTWK
jgi:uncharacterized protein with HEPN domain